MTNQRRCRGITKPSDVPSTDSWGAWLWEILPVAGKSWIDRQHWGPDPSSTRTGTRHQINRSRGLPHETGPQVQTVPRGFRDRWTHSGRMQNAGRKVIHRTAQISGWHHVQEHVHQVWTRPSQVQVGDSSKSCGNYQGKTPMELLEPDRQEGTVHLIRHRRSRRSRRRQWW